MLFLAVVGAEGLIIVTTVECAQGSEAQKGSVNQVVGWVKFGLRPLPLELTGRSIQIAASSWVIPLQQQRNPRLQRR